MSIRTTWTPSYLNVRFAGNGESKARQLVGQARVWVTTAGDVWNIDEMNSNHLLNTLLYLGRVAADISDYARDGVVLGAAEWLVEQPLYASLKEEVLNRMHSEWVPAADVNDPAADLEDQAGPFYFQPEAAPVFVAYAPGEPTADADDGEIRLA